MTREGTINLLEIDYVIGNRLEIIIML